MAKNEAKIQFTAETGEFNDSIKKANSELAELRAEMKLNSEQMKTTGESVEGLEKKHKILQDQLVASHEKTEALTNKLETAKRIFGENSDEVSKLRVQVTNAETAEEKLKQAIQKCADELTEQKTAANKTETATEKLTAEIEEQQSELKTLKNKYADLVVEQKDSTDEAQDLKKQIEKLSSELKDNKDTLKKAADAADELEKSYENAGESAKEASDGFTVMKGAMADLASEAIQSAIGAVGDLVGYIGDLPEATREARQDMATLETSFDKMGFSTEQATDTWKRLYAVFGEDDRAVEASNLIAKMAKDQEDLDKWVTITTGVWGTYQDSLPVEGLAEASMETAKTGTVTGGLADALNWSSEAAVMFADYMGGDVVTAEDAFNVALSECSNEQERQQMITDTLTKLYGEAADTYREASGAQMEAKEATAEHMLVENDLATAIEPVTTAFGELKTMLLESLQPAVEKISGAMTTALEWAKEHPVAMKAIAAAVGVLAVGLGGLAIAVGIYTAAQWAMNSAILANPITWIVVGIVAAIAALVAIGVVLYENWDTIKAKCSEIWNNIKNAFNNGKEAVVNKVNELKTAVVEKFNALKSSATEKFNAVKNAILKPIESARDKVKGIVDNIKGFFSGMKLSFPNIKLPHFSIKPSGWKIGDLLKGSIPSLGIEWYKEGGIMTKPTIFGVNGNNLMAGGEAGAEAILPIDRLNDYITGAIEKAQNVVNLQALADAVEDLANRPVNLNINGRTFAQATASDGDSVNGLRSSFRNRGLALD